MLYLIYGEEVGDSGTFHHQGFVVFKNRKSLENLKELNNHAHWEVTKGTNEQASSYCKKDGKFFEEGVCPEDKHKKGGKATSEKWRAISDYAKSGQLDKIDEEHPKVYVNSYRNLKQLKVDHMSRMPDLESVCGVWIHGPSGAGKSHRARELYPDAYPKMCNKVVVWLSGRTKRYH